MLLGYISDRTFKQTGALITALVVDDDAKREPGEGFFRLAAARGLLREEDVPEQGVPWTKMTTNQRAFWESQLRILGFRDH
jgi:hypothetical protein